jgi:hypothetical protein
VGVPPMAAFAVPDDSEGMHRAVRGAGSRTTRGLSC